MRKKLSVFLCILILLSLSLQVSALSTEPEKSVMDDTAQYLFKTVPEPQVGSTGGEWTVLGLARSDADIPSEYYENYYHNVEKYVKECGGKLNDKKYTEYSRVILALTAIGKNPGDVAGYNLLMPLGDYEKTVWQGVNGSIWALIALDSGGYQIPENPEARVQASREMYVNHILENQTSEGGWGLSGSQADPDITAMALQALSRYQDKPAVKSAIEKALTYMSENQNPEGGFSSWGTENSESSAQMIVALCELGIPLDDTRFVKNGNTILDNMLSFYVKDKGFRHTSDDTAGSNLMASEQCFYSLAAAERAAEGRNSLYSMSDAVNISGDVSGNERPAGRNPDVKKMSVVSPGKTFEDIGSDENRKEIEELASRQIINGKTEYSYEPESTMTRAEFAAIVTRGLGLPLKSSPVFSDVTGADWFYDYVNTAFSYGIVKGVSETCFNPYGTITREEAAVMTARAAKLCGLDTGMDALQARDILSGFTDYVKVSDWAVLSMAFCYDSGIIPDDEMEIMPAKAASRSEIALMLYNTLNSAELL